MSIQIHLNRLEEWSAASGMADTLERSVVAALETAERPLRGEVAVTFISEAEIRELSARYLGKCESTDVIAFELGGGERLLGDVYVAPEVACRAAKELKISEAEELVRLVVHGTLHVLGHEHPEREDREGSPMYRLQEALVDRVMLDRSTS